MSSLPRYEKKFSLPIQEKENVAIELLRHPVMWTDKHTHHSIAFKEIYEPRTIYDVYFDTPDLSLYQSSQEGTGKRYKVRLRWYNSQIPSQTPMLEIKYKDGELGTKERYLCNYPSLPFSDPFFDLNTLIINDQCTLPRALWTHLRPEIQLSYKRHYYQCDTTNIRATLDYDYQVSPLDNPEKNNPNTLENPLILEFKFPSKDYEKAYQLTSRLPYQIAKFSKYVTGINILRR